MEKIDKIFINKAISIRKEYLRHCENIDIDSFKLKECKEKLQTYLEEGNEISEKYNDEESTEFQKEINDIINKVVKTVKQLESRIKPYKDRIKELESESDKLFISIKDRYPKLSTEEIQKQIIEKL
jgi:chromosome segregation ATPase